MKKLFNLSLLLVISMLLTSAVSAQSAGLDGISSAIRGGNAKSLAAYFDNSVEVTIIKQEGAYSRSQAEVVIREFFAKSTPKGFKIIHKGESGGNSKYVIGQMTSSKGTYRTYIYVKKKGEKTLIQEIRFEEE